MKILTVGVVLFLASGRTDGRTERQTDRHDEINSRPSQFCDHFSKLLMLSIECIVWFLDWSLSSINRWKFIVERHCVLKPIHIHCVAVNIVKIYNIILVLCLALNTNFLSTNMFPLCLESSLV
jgi:hypothetical protein